LLAIFRLFGQQKEEPVATLNLSISFYYKNLPIEKALEDLEGRYKLNFAYINDDIPLSNKVYAYAKNKPLKQALNQLFLNTQVSYYVLKEQIVLVSSKTIDSLGLKDKRKIARSQDSITVTTIGRGPYAKGKQHVSIADFFKPIIKTEIIYENYQDGRATDTTYLRNDSTLQLQVKKNEEGFYKVKKRIRLFPRFGVDLVVSPEYSYWKMTSDNYTEENLGIKNTYGKPELGYTMGLKVNYYLTPQISIATGFSLSTVNKSGIHTDSLINTLDPSKGYTSSFRYSANINYLSIPFHVNFQGGSGKFGYSVSSGISISLFLGSGGSRYHQNYQTRYYFNFVSEAPPFFSDAALTKPILQNEIEYRKTILDLTFSPVVTYKLKKRLMLLSGPEIKYFVGSVYDKKPVVVESFYTIGWKLSLRYYLGRY
jgi:hypothetical protein